MGGKESKLVQEFEVKKMLGSGAFGAVIKVQNKFDDNSYAVKLVILNSANKADALKEVKTFSKVSSHENVVSYKTSWIDLIRRSEFEELKKGLQLTEHDAKVLTFSPSIREVEILCIQMELCQENLRSWNSRNVVDVNSMDSIRGVYCKKLSKVNEDKSLLILSQIVCGLEHIHEHEIIHRDLKPENIFLIRTPKGDLIAKIGDLGIAKAHDFKQSVANHTNNGTIIYMPPEQMGGKYGPMVDIYSLGIIAFELFYPCHLDEAFLEAIVKLRTTQTFPEHVQLRWPEMIALISTMIKPNYQERPKIDVIKKAMREIGKIFGSGYPHWSVRCDGCKTKPIRGARYKCKSCDDFDFCSTCKENKVKHMDGHEFRSMDTATSEKEYLGNVKAYLESRLLRGQEEQSQTVVYECFKCKQRIDTTNSTTMVRKCQTCDNCYYCDSCFQESHVHKRIHTFKEVGGTTGPAAARANEGDKSSSSNSSDESETDLLIRILLAMALAGKTNDKN